MRRVAAWLVIMCLCATGAAAQRRNLKEENKRRDQRLNDPGRYARILDAYLAADDAHSVDLLADPEWDEQRLRMFLRFMDYAGGGRYWPQSRWAAAALMHVDVALKLSPTLEEEARAAAVHLWVSNELVRLGIRERGHALLASKRSRASFLDLAERMYVALARLLVDRLAPASAERMLRTARDRLPGRASILYESGRLAELFATDYALIGRVSMTSGSRGQTVMLEQIQQRRNGYLNDAATWLRQAAALAPADDQLHVHFGRVLALRGNDDEATAILLRATQSQDDATAYLASMFLGGLRERQQRLDEAAAAYRAAIGRFPHCHAGYIGLGEVLQRGGTTEEARAVMSRRMSAQAGITREPLWWYHVEPPGVAVDRLDALRREVRQ